MAEQRMIVMTDAAQEPRPGPVTGRDMIMTERRITAGRPININDLAVVTASTETFW